MSLLLHGDCLEHLHSVDDNSVDLIFCDLPYGQTSCKWDCKIDLTKLWDHFMRIKKLNTPLFFTTTTKFGCDLIQSAPKKCFFRYDLVWVKSAPAGFLCAKKMPMRKHEMVYVFYEKLPLYDLSSHTHKFIKERDAGQKNGSVYGGEEGKKLIEGKYDPPLPVSVMKEDKGCYGEKVPNSEAKYGQKCARQYDPPLPVSVVKEINNDNIYRGGKGKPLKDVGVASFGATGSCYDPPLPVSVVKEDLYGQDKEYKEKIYDEKYGKKGKNQVLYDPPLPVSVVREEKSQISKPQGADLYGASKGGTIGNVHGTNYEPPLPVSVFKEEKKLFTTECETAYGKATHHSYRSPVYEPMLPTSVLKEPEPEPEPEQVIEEKKVFKVKENGACKNYGVERVYYYDENGKKLDGSDGTNTKYEPPLPTTMLEIKSTRGKHSTEKPVALMEWILKYYSKEGDVVLDPTMGSGSTGVACKNMNRNFIGIEMDDEIYEVAVNRIE